MQDLEKYPVPPVQGEVIDYVDAAEDSQSSEDLAQLIPAIFRRWYIILLCTILIGGGGAAAIWFFMPEKYETQGSVLISSVVVPIMYETTPHGGIGAYQTFKNTQAGVMTSDEVLNRVADAIKDKNLIFFEPGQNLLQALRDMVSKGDIEVIPDRQTEFLHVQMKTEHPRDAEILIDAFLRSYEAIVRTDEIKDIDDRLARLEAQRRILEEQMRRQRAQIRERVDEFGTEQLTPRQEIALQQVATLKQEQIAIGVQRMQMEARVQAKEQQLNKPLTVEDITTQIELRVENDPSIVALRQDIRRYEQLIRDGQATMLETNPEMQRRKQVLEELQQELEKQRQEVTARYEKNLLAEAKRVREEELEALRGELNRLITYENKIAAQLAEQDQNTIQIGRTQLDINDLREQYENSRNIYNEITRRIEELNIERDRKPRISVASWARSVSSEGKKMKLILASPFGGLAIGLAFAFLLAKLDRRVHTPEDIARRVGVRIIGTTTGPEHVSRKLLARQLVDDYQTIRANLGLLNGNGSIKMLVITSPGMGDGKSTLAVNLATSFANSGRKTLLIDGDLRKPDVAAMLQIPNGHRGIQDYLFGADLQRTLYHVEGLPLFVLACDDRNSEDAFEMLSVPDTAERIRHLRDEFDYIIIDTPPVLAFADAMVWAKMADGVIMTSFVGQTSQIEMKQALARLQEIKANIIGTVVNNVKTTDSYRRYGYGYGYHYSAKKHPKRTPHKSRKTKTLLLGEVAGTTETTQ
jgi:capsular exopolysaccharide synthesis family protein